MFAEVLRVHTITSTALSRSALRQWPRRAAKRLAAAARRQSGIHFASRGYSQAASLYCIRRRFPGFSEYGFGPDRGRTFAALEAMGPDALSFELQ